MARPANLYEELAKFSNEDSLNKTASVKSAEQIRNELDEIGYSSEKIESLAQEIFGFCKSAEEVVNNEDDTVEEKETLEDTAVADTPEDEVKDKAIAVIEEKVEDLQDAVDVLKEIDGNGEDVQALDEAVEEVKTAFEALGFMKTAAEDEGEEVEKTEEEVEEKPDVDTDTAMATVEEKVMELAQAVDDLKEVEGVDVEKAEDAVINAAAAYADYRMMKVAEEAMAILDNADEETKDAIITDAYNKAGEVLQANGIDLVSYIASKLDNPDLAPDIAETVTKLAIISGRNEYEVADDVVGTVIAKVTSE